MKLMISYIFEAAAFLFTVTLFSNIFTRLGYDIDYKNIAIVFLIIWIIGKMALRRYLIKLSEKNATLGKKGKKHN